MLTDKRYLRLLGLFAAIIALSQIGMVVRAGAAKPDIGSVEAFKRMLLAVKSIGYSDSGSGTYFGVDPELDMIYILLEQTQNERGRITPAFRKLVYDAFATDK